MLRLLPLVFLVARPGRGQDDNRQDSLLHDATLAHCVQYALEHQPRVRESMIDEQITDKSINSALSDWYPHISFSSYLQHNIQLPVSIFQGNAVNVGLKNTSSGQFSVTQTVFDRDVLLASSTAQELRDQGRDNTAGASIDVVVGVSKAYYAVLLTEDQISIANGDIERLRQSVKDAYNQYRAGVVDRTDYERATVSLNNAEAEQKLNTELLNARYVALKDQMGCPADTPLVLQRDTANIDKEVFVDTLRPPRYEERVEYQLLLIRKRLAEAALHYAQWSFLPSVSIYGEYNLNYENNRWADLYLHDYPNSYVGVQLTFPIFQGGKRFQDLALGSLGIRRVDEELRDFRNSVDMEYAQAMSGYKSNLFTYELLKRNVQLARDVYHTIQLQYRAGTRSYLDVISAETDLRSSEENEANALYQVLSSKLDVQKALGTIQY